MENLGKVRSTVKPPETEILETSVFVASDVTEVSEQIDEQNDFNGYEYTLVRYEKNEYIQKIQEQNQTIKSELLDTQMALCEVYEMLG
jgi:hypothetical protein